LATQGAFCAIMRRGRFSHQLLMAVRADGKGLNLIGGRREEGEALKQTAQREALEETGLEVEVIDQIGDNLPMVNEKEEVVDVACIYSVAVSAGELRLTTESIGFKWVSLVGLPKAQMVKRACPGYPEGRTYAMAELALRQQDPVLSQVQNPQGLATSVSSIAEELNARSERAITRRLELNERIKLEAQHENAQAFSLILEEAREASDGGMHTICIPSIRVGLDTLSDAALNALVQQLKAEGLKVEVGIGTYYDGSLFDLKEPLPRHDIEAHEKRMELIDSHTKKYVSHITLSW